MQWMLWTLPTAAFFAGIVIILAIMTVWQILQPTRERRGWIIPMRTTRGDRLFIGLLASAYLSALWVALIPLTSWLLLLAVIVLMLTLMFVG
ncbi:DUF2160 domain-containing protein [Salinisphaera sp. LB1]|uniref:DUF2160 domain-containing protein n=1 Tax=Salinisphaera sp. LB1 TaxID=2183911 RepID=UPI000D706AE0|nr:DUF2160 family membrane protein [Salinisphaera sp. LB1]AWN16800.1 putative integral membrane protein [Salinisphaera sp. LB1]